MQEKTEKTTNEVALLDYKKLPAFLNAQQRQEQLVIDNPFIKIKDPESFNIAKKRRTALRTGRTELQNGEKLIVSKVTAFRKEVGTETEKLILITKSHEEKQQAEIERYEAEKQKLKDEADRIERERVEAIKNKIIVFKGEIKDLISRAVIENVKSIKDTILNTSIECEEFESDFELVKEQLIELYEEKVNQLNEDEQRKLAQKKIDEERAIINLEKDRFQELKGILFIYEGDDLGTLTNEQYKAIYHQAKAEFDLIEASRIEKEKQEKEKQQLGLKRRMELKAVGCDVDVNTCANMSDEVWNQFSSTKKESYEAEQKRIKKERLEQEQARAAETKRRVDLIKSIGYEFNYDEQLFKFGKVEIELSEFDVINESSFNENFLPSAKRVIEAEKDRIEALRPEKEKLIEYVKSYRLKHSFKMDNMGPTALKLYNEFNYKIENIVDSYLKTIKNL